MALFDAQVRRIERFVAAARRAKKLIECPPPKKPWPKGDALVLAEDTGCELGNPAIGSVFALVWSESLKIGKGRTWRIGPDIPELTGQSVPLCMFVLMRVSAAGHEYECYARARDAIAETRLAGLMARMLPARRNVWCRVSRAASKKGFSFGHWGGAILKRLAALDFVSGADVLFVADNVKGLAELAEVSDEAGRVVGALCKMSEEMNLECSGCEFAAVCDAVEDLRRIRSRLIEGRENG